VSSHFRSSASRCLLFSADYAVVLLRLPRCAFLLRPIQTVLFVHSVPPFYASAPPDAHFLASHQLSRFAPCARCDVMFLYRPSCGSPLRNKLFSFLVDALFPVARSPFFLDSTPSTVNLNASFPSPDPCFRHTHSTSLPREFASPNPLCALLLSVPSFHFRRPSAGILLLHTQTSREPDKVRIPSSRFPFSLSLPISQLAPLG